MEWTRMLVVSLQGCRLGCSGKNAIIFSRQGLVKGCTRRNNKTERIFILYVSRGLHKLLPRPDWSILGVKFKISDKQPRPFDVRVPPDFFVSAMQVKSSQS